MSVKPSTPTTLAIPLRLLRRELAKTKTALRRINPLVTRADASGATALANKRRRVKHRLETEIAELDEAIGVLRAWVMILGEVEARRTTGRRGKSRG